MTAPTASASLASLERFCRVVLAAAGADSATADAATRAMLHGSRLGVDSHGVRLLHHYVTGILGGRLNARPALRFSGGLAAVATLDADNAHGALATYAAMDHAVGLAEKFGIGAVGICNSSHFGPAGAYALAAAEKGCLGLAVCNTDKAVRLHDGAARFHGTNPIAFAAPAAGGPPWLLDMATSAIPFNRVQLFRSLRRTLPEAVASAMDGQDTRDPDLAEMLAPLGGEFGFKGAGLAGLVEILSAVMTGMKLSFDIAAMGGPDFATPRTMGAFVLALRADAFVDRDAFDRGMAHYLAALRGSPARGQAAVMAPGDREWAEAGRREAAGVPLDPVTVTQFRELGERFGIMPPV